MVHIYEHCRLNDGWQVRYVVSSTICHSNLFDNAIGGLIVYLLRYNAFRKMIVAYTPS